ncbi:hypothetical protein KW846_19930 [Pseudomonas sp. PDM32]|uniref:hypothetical protein n=1 Tax=Pseudomonas sp. PDM32 TaxID=2854768 RepID=UPI001C48535B|nr:hypothetical protein [Pseudomonas sp. PDM32]MBV7574982.1 hypothetical protein [Pseudomonas sp. PDM32]
MAGNRNSGVMAAEPLYICRGAEHDLKFAAVEDSPWINQGASVNPIPGETLYITTEPEFGQYQPLLAEGGEWKLKCPAEGTDIDFNLQVQSEFTAVPYQFPFKLGDYRRKILNERDPISAPVVGDEVSAEIQVGSFYIEKELEGVDVEWYFDGKIVRTEPTTGSGWSKFDHVVTAEGEHTITAKVYSRYDDTTSEYTFTLNVYLERVRGMTGISLKVSKLLSSDLLDEADIFLDGTIIPADGVNFYAGRPKELSLRYKNGGYLSGVPLKLIMVPKTGLGPDDVLSDPPFLLDVPVHKWTVTGAEGKWGTFDLVASVDAGKAEIRTPALQLLGNIATELELRFNDKLRDPGEIFFQLRVVIRRWH